MKIRGNEFLKIFPRAYDAGLRLATHGLLVAVGIGAILFASIVTYLTFLRVYMPDVSHHYDLNFIFGTDCEKNPLHDEGLCTFPFTNVSFPGGSLLSRGLAYDFKLTLHVPESEKNIRIGMFLNSLSFYDQAGSTRFTAKKSAMLRYRSVVLRYFDRFVLYPLYLFSFFDESQKVEVSLLQDYYDDAYHPSHGLVLRIHSPFIEIYSAELKIVAQLSGIRYLLHNRPIISAIFGVAFCATVYSFIILVSAAAVYWRCQRRLADRCDDTYFNSEDTLGTEHSDSPTLEFYTPTSNSSSDGIQDNDVSSSSRGVRQKSD